MSSKVDTKAPNCWTKVRSVLGGCCQKNDTDPVKQNVKESKSLLRPNALNITKKVAIGTAITGGVIGGAVVVALLGTSAFLLFNPAGTMSVASAVFGGAGSIAASTSTTVLGGLSVAALPLTISLGVVVIGAGTAALSVVTFKVIRPWIMRGKYLNKQIEKADKQANKLQTRIYDMNEKVEALREEKGLKIAKLVCHLKQRSAELELAEARLNARREGLKEQLDKWSFRHAKRNDVTSFDRAD